MFFFLRKLTVSDNVNSALETTLTKAQAPYRYNGIIPKTIFVSTGSKRFGSPRLFNRELFRRFAVGMTLSYAFFSTEREYRYHFRNSGLQSITVYRNGFQIAGTHSKRDVSNKLYLNSLEAVVLE